MDALLLRTGQVPLLALAFFVAIAGEGWDAAGVWPRVVAAAIWPLALRAAALQGDVERNGAPPPRWAAVLRRWVVRLRWPLAVLAAASAGAYAHQHNGRPWVTALAAVPGGVAAALAARPLPAVTPRPVPPRPAPAGPDPSDPYRAPSG